MASTFFDETRGEDLVSVPLKSPYLDEFVRLAREAVSVLNQIILKTQHRNGRQ